MLNRLKTWNKVSGEIYDLTNFDNFINTGVCIDVDVADSLTVAEHRNAFGCPLNVPYQLGWTSRDDQVNHLVQSTQILHLLTSAHLVTNTGLNNRYGKTFRQIRLSHWFPIDWRRWCIFIQISESPCLWIMWVNVCFTAIIYLYWCHGNSRIL